MRIPNLSLGLVMVAVLCVAASTKEIKSPAQPDSNKETNTAPASGAVVPKEAIDAAIAGRFDEALPAYQANVERDPNNGEAHSDLAGMLMMAGRTDEALKESREAVRLAPKSARCVHDLAVVLGTVGRGKEAVEELKHAIRLDPNYVDAHTDLGAIHLAVGRYAEAIQCFTDSLAIKNTRKARLGRALALDRSDNSAATVEDCTQILKENTHDHEAYVYRSFANMRCGQYDAALRDAEQGLAIDGECSYLAYTVLGGVSFTRNDNTAAFEYLTKAITLNPKEPLPYIFRAFVRLRAKLFEYCIADLDAAIKTAPDAQHLNLALNGFGWQVYKFRGFLKLGTDPKAAISDLTQAIALNDHDADCYALRSLAYYNLAKWKECLEDADHALGIRSDHAMAIYFLTGTLASCPDSNFRDGQRALKLAQAACAKSEWKRPEYIGELADAYSEIGEFDNAVLLQEQAIALIDDAYQGMSFEVNIWWKLTTPISITLNKKESHDSLDLFQQHKPRHLHRIATEPTATQKSVGTAQRKGE